MQQSISNAEFIKKLIPHREPMIMVDGLQYYDGKKAMCTLRILESFLFVENTHFSENGLIEHMAQSTALFTGYKYHLQDLPTKVGFIAAIKNLKIEGLPKVNDLISTEVQITHEIDNITIVKVRSKVKESTISSAEMTLVLKENE
ncbi:MAG: hypothetical protein ABIO60_05100 [Aquaticitalea sp.]